VAGEKARWRADGESCTDVPAECPISDAIVLDRGALHAVGRVVPWPVTKAWYTEVRATVDEATDIVGYPVCAPGTRGTGCPDGKRNRVERTRAHALLSGGGGAPCGGGLFGRIGVFAMASAVRGAGEGRKGMGGLATDKNSLLPGITAMLARGGTTCGPLGA